MEKMNEINWREYEANGVPVTPTAIYNATHAINNILFRNFREK